MTESLLNRFSRALGWNAFLYIVYKISATLLSFYLFSLFSTTDFSVWININAFLYLTPLLIDLGFRKSIPRFAPIFNQSKQSFKRFITVITHLSLTLLCLVAPIFYYFVTYFFVANNIAVSSALIMLSTLIFITEGLVSISRLIFHAHFWNKQFNLLITATVLTEIVVNLTAAIINPHGRLLLIFFHSKLIINMIVLFGSYLLFLSFKRSLIFRTNEAVDTKETWHSFARHSLMMWFTNSTKSLSERNFLVPILTLILGPLAANFFKIANAGALLFRRAIIKTIGTSDTALLAHVEITKKRDLFLPAFNLIIRRIIVFCCVMLGIFFFFFIHGPPNIMPFSAPMFSENKLICNLMLILTLSHLVEVLLSPYERLLEVRQRYKTLFTVYIPFLILLVALFYGAPLMGLMPLIIGIQALRLTAIFFIAFFAKSSFGVQFPTLFALRLLLLSLISAVAAHYVVLLVTHIVC